MSSSRFNFCDWRQSSSQVSCCIVTVSKQLRFMGRDAQFSVFVNFALARIKCQSWTYTAEPQANSSSSLCWFHRVLLRNLGFPWPWSPTLFCLTLRLCNVQWLNLPFCGIHRDASRATLHFLLPLEEMHQVCYFGWRRSLCHPHTQLAF